MLEQKEEPKKRPEVHLPRGSSPAQVSHSLHVDRIWKGGWGERTTCAHLPCDLASNANQVAARLCLLLRFLMELCTPPIELCSNKVCWEILHTLSLWSNYANRCTRCSTKTWSAHTWESHRVSGPHMSLKVLRWKVTGNS